MVYKGVDAGIERMSKILMPVLLVLILCISCFSLTLSHTDDSGVTRTGLQGLLVYVVPNFDGMTLRKFLVILTDARGSCLLHQRSNGNHDYLWLLCEKRD